MKESARRPEINLNGVFYLKKIETIERPVGRIRNGIITSAGMYESAWNHTTTDCKEDVEAKMNLISIDVPQEVNKCDNVASTSTMKIEEGKELVTASSLLSYLFFLCEFVLKLYELLFISNSKNFSETIRCGDFLRMKECQTLYVLLSFI